MGQWNEAQGVDGNRFNKSFRSLVIVYVWCTNTSVSGRFDFVRSW